jgi:uncharacterized membrane protein
MEAMEALGEAGIGVVLSIVLLLPVVLFLAGLMMWIAGKPEKINWWAGYRTSRATKNQETWVFAQRYFGKLSLLSGCTTLTFSIGAIIHREHLYIVAWALGAQVVAFILTCIFTEMALRKEFDKNGERRR